MQSIGMQEEGATRNIRDGQMVHGIAYPARLERRIWSGHGLPTARSRRVTSIYSNALKHVACQCFMACHYQNQFQENVCGLFYELTGLLFTMYYPSFVSITSSFELTMRFTQSPLTP